MVISKVSTSKIMVVVVIIIIKASYKGIIGLVEVVKAVDDIWVFLLPPRVILII